MDDIAQYNAARWRALAEANALFTRPYRGMTPAEAREMVGEMDGKSVLCLAGGGGKQSVMFGLAGARVTVVDLSPEQLSRDREMEAHHKLSLRLYQGDMRDLSMLDAHQFDLVYQPYSLNFVPDAVEVFTQVSRVIKPGGIYEFECANPFAAGVREADWNGEGYTVKRPYQQGQRIEYQDEDWVYDRQQYVTVAPPVEYRHTMSALVDGLVKNGFVIQAMREMGAYDASPDAEPGTWSHFCAILPPWWKIRVVRGQTS